MTAYLLYGGLAIAVAWVAGQRSMAAVGLLVAAIGLRIAFGFLEHSVIVFDDEGHYLEQAAEVDDARIGVEGIELGRTHENHWVIITATHHRVFGKAFHPMRALNVFLGIMMALLMGRVARLLRATPKTEECVYYFGLFGPPMLFLGCNILKEQAMAVVLGLIVCGLLERGLGRVWILMAGLFALWVVRFKLLPFAIFGILGLGIYTYFDVFRNADSRVKWAVGVTALGAWILFCAFFSDLLIYSPLGKYLTAFMGMPAYDMNMQDLPAFHASSAGVGGWLDRENPFSMRNMAVLSVRNLYSPGVCQFIADPSREQGLYCFAANIWWWAAVPFFAVRLLSAHGALRRHLAVGLVIGVMYLIATATDLTVFQQSWRYRWAIWPVFFTVAIMGLLEPSGWKRGVNLIWWISVAAFCAVYFW